MCFGFEFVLCFCILSPVLHRLVLCVIGVPFDCVWKC